MNGLLWREYRRNRWILVTGAALIPLPFVIASWATVQADDHSSAFFAAYVVSTLLSVMLISLIGGNAIAADRADRSAEHLANLPFGWWRMLVSKLFLPLITTVVLCVVNLLVLMPPVESWPADEWPTTGTLPERFQWSVLLASSGLLICGVSLMVSSYQSSSALATISGLIAAFLAAGPHEEADFLFPVFPVIFVTMAVGCFCIGSRRYLRIQSKIPHQGAKSMIAIEDETRSVAMLISSVLFRAFLLGSGLLALSSIPVLFLTDEIYAVHQTMLDIPRPEYNALLFGWLGDMKLLLLTFFLLPAIATRWALRNAE